MTKAEEVRAVNREYFKIVSKIKNAPVEKKKKIDALQKLHASKVKAVAKIYGDSTFIGDITDDHDKLP